MQTEQSRTDNGRDQRALERGPRAGAIEPEGSSGIGDVAKDAFEHLKVIVSDSVEIGKLEAKRLAERVETAGKDIAPRIAVGAVAAIVGFSGIVLGLIALFIALGEVIPSVAARLGIYAAAFILIAAAGSFFAFRPRKEHREERALVPTSQISR